MRRTITLALLAAVAIAGARGVAPALDSVYRLYVTRDFEEARDMLGRLEGTYTRGNDRFLVRVELGDLLLDKLGEYAAAEEVFAGLLEEFPKDKRRPEILYRLALAQELQEKYLDAAQNYEVVATKHMKSKFGTDALDAIERCFRKNYQDRVAYVDGFPITRIELDDRISRYPSAYEQFDKKQELLDTMIDNRLLFKAARDAGVMTMPEYEPGITEARNRYVFEEWYDREVTSRAEPTDRQIKGQYRKDKGTKYTTPEKVHAYRIQVEDRATADSLRNLLLSDTAIVWDSLAKKHSTAADKDRAGDMGFFARGVHEKPIESTVFRMKPGQVSKPVQVEDGWVLLKMVERKPKEVRLFEDVQNQIKLQLRQENTERLYEEKLADLKKKVGFVEDTTAVEVGKDTLAVVDGLVIDRAQLQERIETIPPFFRSQFQSPEGQRRILDQLVSEKLILKDAEAQDMWLWNRVVDKVLERRTRLMIDAYRDMSTKVELDTAEVRADYEATIEEFKVPAQVHARQIQTKSRSRALQLRRWATGTTPAFVQGRALLVTEDEAVETIRDSLLALENTEMYFAERAFSTAPGAILPNTPMERIAGRFVPDMSKPVEHAGPYGQGADPGYALAFAPVSAEDKLYLPELHEVATAEELVEVTGEELEESPDTNAVLVVDSTRLGTYIGLREELPASFLKSLLKLEADDVSEPYETDDGALLVHVVRKDTAGKTSFEDLAKRFSTAPDRYSGGDMYWLRRGDESRDSKIINAAFSLGEGRVSSVMKLNDTTWTFIKVEEKKKASTRPLDEVREKIVRKLTQEKQQALFDETLDRLRGQAEIEIVMTPEDFIFEMEMEEEPGTPEDETGTEPTPDKDQ